MYKSAPQTTIFDLVRQMQRAQRYVFNIILGISLIVSLNIIKVFDIPDNYISLINLIYLCLIISLFIVTAIIDYYLLPGAERKTRCDFFDNSFGTKFISSKGSENYYTNDEIKTGIYKMAVNLFESVLYTLTISRKMIIRRSIYSAFLFTVVVIMGFYGFRDLFSFFILFLQTLLSTYFIGGLVKLVIYVIKNNSYFEELKLIFSIENLMEDIDKHMAQIIRVYADYESNKGWANLALSSSIYKNLNPKLIEEWNGMKVKYNIN